MKQLLFKKELIDEIYKYLEKSDKLRKDYKIENFYALIRLYPEFMEHIFTIEKYINFGHLDYIIPELEDHIILINQITNESRALDINYIFTETDLDYLIDIVNKRFNSYKKFLKKEHLLMMVYQHKEILFGVITKKMDNDIMGSKSLLENVISISLVGQYPPCPCANNKIKQDYSNLFNDLPIYDEL